MKVNDNEVIQVKTFFMHELYDLEIKVNEFLNDSTSGVDELVDIKFSHNSEGFYAMVIYKYISK